MCTGILYGNGEKVFYEHFRKAWINEKVPLLGEGFNTIPTIHVVDVARLIKKIIFEPPKTKYILAVDNGMNSLREIIESLVNGD